MKKVIVTGATGQIGLALIELCIENNIFVTVIANPSSKRKDSITKSQFVDIVECDINDYDQLTLNNNYDCFFHLAWRGTTGDDRNNEEIQKANYNAALSSIRLAKRCGCKKYIGIGSQAEYGRKDYPLTSKTECLPENMYGKYKLKSGIDGNILANELGIEFNWVRVLSVFGKSLNEASLPAYIMRELSKGKIPKFTPSEQIWDFLYSKDAADALLKVAQKGINGKTYVLGSGVGKPLKEYIKSEYSIISPDTIPAFGDIKYSVNQTMYLVADISELTKDTGFIPKYSFEDAIKDIIKEV